MSDYDQCQTCRAWAWLSRHKCPPTWDWRHYWIADQADEWVLGEIYARDAEVAAEEAAKAYDMDDYPLTRGSGASAA